MKKLRHCAIGQKHLIAVLGHGFFWIKTFDCPWEAYINNLGYLLAEWVKLSKYIALCVDCLVFVFDCIPG